MCVCACVCLEKEYESMNENLNYIHIFPYLITNVNSLMKYCHIFLLIFLTFSCMVQRDLKKKTGHLNIEMIVILKIKFNI